MIGRSAREINKRITILKNELLKVGLSINKDKTEFMEFGKKSGIEAKF